MEKLQPIIQQRFWILLVICLGLATFGYFKGQAAMVSATKAREETLTKIKGDISNGKSPNKEYQTKLAYINGEYEKSINESIKELFEGQKALMWWPEGLKPLIPALHRDAIDVATRVKYAREYPRLIEDLWTRVEPVVPKDIPGQRPQTVRGARPEKPVKATWTQKVYCAKEGLPQKFLDQKFVPPDAVWDAQEDIWFVERIFEAIRAINQSADSPLSAVVRKVNLLSLRGGDGETGGGEEAMDGALSSDDSGGGRYAQMSRMMGAVGGAQGGLAGGGGMGAEFTAPVAFDPSEEFGSDAAPMEEAASDDEGGSGFQMMSLSGSMGGGRADMPTLRWYKLDDQAPYRERAFYLSVIMQQSQIPDFMIALLDSPWPVRIVRFQMGPNPHFQESGGGRSPGGYGNYGSGSLASDDDGGRGAMLGGAGRGSRFGGGSAASAMSMQRGSAGAMGSMGSMGSMASMGGMGGMGMGGRGGYGLGRQASAEVAFINTPADPYIGSLNSPDLVQVDIAGVITFYVETKDDGTAAIETSAVDSQSAVSAEDAATDENGAPIEGEGAIPGDEAAPADGTPETDPANTDPAATDPAAETAPAGDAGEAATEEPAAGQPTEETVSEPAAETPEADSQPDSPN